MLRQARSLKVHDWLVNYVVKKNRSWRGWPVVANSPESGHEVVR
jgi:hypothetical protein